MPKRKEIDPPSTEVIKIRVPIETKKECLETKESGPYWRHQAEATFFGYLLNLGLRQYQKVMLPGELAENEPPSKRARISEGPYSATVNKVHPDKKEVNPIHEKKRG